MKLRLSARAQRDLLTIETYLCERSSTAAMDVIDAIEAAIAIVQEHPFASLVVGPGEVRMKVVRPYRYKVFYRVATGIVVIAHIRHPSRSPEWPEE